MKMKTLNILFVLLAGAIIYSCAPAPEGEKSEATDAKEKKSTPTGAMVYPVDNSKSTFEWVGTKPTGTHFGTVDIKRGTLEIKDREIVGGEFVLDMTSITVLDLEGDSKTKLTNHLKSDDFFSVDKYPEAVFQITGTEKFEGGLQDPDGEQPTHLVTGNLNVKGISKSITFGAVVNVTEDNVIASTPQFRIDRTEWDVKFKSRKFFDDLKDNFIHDEIGIRTSIMAAK